MSTTADLVLLLALLLVNLLLAPAPAAARHFRVVAFGDSLTEGWDNKLQKKVPYTSTLRACLRTKTKGRVGIVVDNKGVGWSAVLMSESLHPGANLTKHIIQVVQRAKELGVKYDWAVIWVGGGNELYNSQPPSPFPFATVMKKYAYLWKLCMAQGWKVLMMPNHTLEFGAPGVEADRLKLLAMLKAAVRKAKSPRLKFLDESTMFDAVKTNPALREKYMSDGIHLTKAGYAKVGLAVCKVLAPYAARAP